MAEPQWEWYRSFLQVMESGSLSAAARAMGLAQPTVGRHMDALEAALGLRLFTRSSDGFAPTEAALELQTYAASMDATARAMRRVASGHGAGVRGTVRVTASEVVGVEILPPVLAALREEHPALSVELVLSNTAEDLLRREADIAVRMFRPQQEALVARHVGSIALGLHAHERYVSAHGVPASLQALAGHALIGFDRETTIVRQLQQRYPMFTREAMALRSDSDLAQLAAIRAGLGIGVCQSALAARDPGLVKVLPHAFSWELQTWVAMHEDLRKSERCAVVFHALVRALQAYAAS
jgi:DNA-binding transcriptional LysR family regulator